MSTEKSRKSPLLLAIALIGVGIVFGVILVTSFGSNSLTRAFAGSIDDIGAKSAPVTVGSEARILDEAFVSASKAVTPTVVSISVIGEAKTPQNPFGDMFPFFEGPDDEGDEPSPRGGQKSQGSGSGVFITQDGYIVTNARIGFAQRTGRFEWDAFARLNNMTDRRYVGSVIVGDTNGRFFEPAPGRNWFVGASSTIRF